MLRHLAESYRYRSTRRLHWHFGALFASDAIAGTSAPFDLNSAVGWVLLWLAGGGALVFAIFRYRNHGYGYALIAILALPVLLSLEAVHSKVAGQTKADDQGRSFKEAYGIFCQGVTKARTITRVVEPRAIAGSGTALLFSAESRGANNNYGLGPQTIGRFLSNNPELCSHTDLRRIQYIVAQRTPDRSATVPLTHTIRLCPLDESIPPTYEPPDADFELILGQRTRQTVAPPMGALSEIRFFEIDVEIRERQSAATIASDLLHVSTVRYAGLEDYCPEINSRLAELLRLTFPK